MLRSLACQLLSRHPRVVPVRFLRGSKSRQPLPDEAASDTGGGQEDRDADERRKQRARVLQQLERSNPAGQDFTSNQRQDDGDRFGSRRGYQGRNRDVDYDQFEFGPPRKDMNRNKDRNRDEDDGRFGLPRRDSRRSQDRNHDQDESQFGPPQRDMNRSQGRNRDEDYDQFGPPRRDMNRNRDRDEDDGRFGPARRDARRNQDRNRDEDESQFGPPQDQNRFNGDRDRDQQDRPSRWQDQSSGHSQNFSNNMRRANTGSSQQTRRRAYKDEDGENLPGSGGRVRKMLDQASTFSDLQFDREEEVQNFPEGQGKGQVLPRHDPFMSSPYTKETRIPNKVFHGGDSAMLQAQLQQIDPASTSVIIFPGQGTQYVGMCGDVSRMPDTILSLYRTASEILGYDLLDLCQNGPIEKLNQTVYCQPAVFVSSLAALERLRDRNPKAVESCVATAGFSVGEITALVFAGVFSFEDALQLIKVRAEAMQLATELVPSGMATVLYAADSKLNYSLKVAKAWCTKEHEIEDPVCSVANYLFPHCKVVGGHREAIEFLQDNYKDFNLVRVKRLPVSGAFHTELMLPAAEAVRLYLTKIEVNPSRIPVFSNATSTRYHTSHELLKMLPKQIYKPVMWEQILHNLYQRPQDIEYPSTYECGPGKSLSTVLKLVNARARMKTESIDP